MGGIHTPDQIQFTENDLNSPPLSPGTGTDCTASCNDEAAVEAVRLILQQLYRLSDLGFAEGKIDRIRREAIFFLYEGGDAAKWDRARPHSLAARALREVTKGKGLLPLAVRKAITYDHAIPLRCLRSGLREASGTNETMGSFLAQFVKGVVITREENDKLNKLGLRSTMPEGADVDDLTARYRMAGIEFAAADENVLRAR